MASSTARPPRLNISRSTLSLPSTCFASGMPFVKKVARVLDQFFHQADVAFIEFSADDVLLRQAV